jgi:hypothetical protein
MCVSLLVERKWQSHTSVIRASHLYETILVVETVMRSIKLVVLTILQLNRWHKKKELLYQSVGVIILTVQSQLKCRYVN